MLKPALSHQHPIAMAHRGSTILWPENTMAAFQGAVDLGYTYLETDVHATADGVLVCFHDPTLDRTTSESGPVAQRSLADLKVVDAGYHHDPGNDFPYRSSGETVPSLEEVAKTFPDAVLTIDLKAPGLEALMADAVEKLHLADRVIVGAFQERRVRAFRKLTGGRVATSAGPWEAARVVFGAKVDRVMRIGADVLQVPEFHKGVNVVNERVVAAVHAQGKQIHVWTVNDPAEMSRLLDLGVDGLVTDRPDLLKQVLVGRPGSWRIGNE